MSKKKQKPNVEEFRRWVLVNAEGKITPHTSFSTRAEAMEFYHEHVTAKHLPVKPSRAIIRVEVLT